jgi:N-acetylneuraminic acid mutarotase
MAQCKLRDAGELCVGAEEQLVTRARLARNLTRGLATLILAAAVIGAPPATATAQEGGGSLAGLPELEGWAMAAALIEPRSEQSVVELNGKVYVIGGYPHDRIPSSVVQIYDVATGRWGFGPPIPIELHHAPAAVVDGVIYVLGGEYQGAGTGMPAVFLNTVFAFDPAVGQWEPRAPMPTSRSGGGAAVVDGKIYVAGGRPPGGNDFAVYDPARDTWTVLPDLPTGRNHLGMGAIDGLIYVAGGRFGGNFASERTAVVEVYNPADNTWSTRRSMPSPRGGVAAVVANGCLFVIGGEGNYSDPRGLSVENEAYDPRSDTWIALAPMPTPTHGLVGAAFVDGLIFLPGGSVSQGTASASTLHWSYRPAISCEGASNVTTS